MTQKRCRASSIASNDASASSSAHASSRKPLIVASKCPLVDPSQDLDEFQESFWKYQMDLVEQGDGDGGIVDLKSGTPTGGQLPLARIKKAMKSDDQVKMISAEAPILFSRACEIFISDLTCRAFLIAEEHKRRTIQRSDITGAIGRSDLFDFLIDVIPRHESMSSSRLPGNRAVKVERTAQGQNASRAAASSPTNRAQQGDYHYRVGGQEAASHYVDMNAQPDSINMPHGSWAEHDMSSWLNETAGEQASCSDSQPHLEYTATAVPHSWQQTFPDLSTHGVSSGHVDGLDSLF